MSTFVLQSGFNTRIATDTVRHAVYRYRTITRSDRNTYYGGSGWDKGPENNHALITVAPGEVPAEIATADQKKNRSRSWFSGDYSDIAIFDNRDDALRLIALLETLHVPGDLDVILRATEGTAAELAHPTLEQFLRLSRGKSKAATTAAEWMSEHLGNELLPQLVDAVEEELDSGSPKVRTLRPLLAACTQMILGPGQDQAASLDFAKLPDSVLANALGMLMAVLGAVLVGGVLYRLTEKSPQDMRHWGLGVGVFMASVGLAMKLSG